MPSGTSDLFSVYLGMNAKIYVGGKEFANVKDVTMNFSRATADVTTRANDGWRANVGTLREATASFQMVKYADNTGDATNNDAETILSAFLGRDGNDLLPVACNRNEALEDAVTYDVELSLTKFVGWYPTDTKDASDYIEGI